MECHVYRDTAPHDRLGVLIREPECGEDFCDHCGDCLSCYTGGPCVRNEEGGHSWVIEMSQEEWDALQQPLSRESESAHE